MTYAAYNSVAFSNLAGLAIAPLASVAVLREVDGAVATLYADAQGATPLANPFPADALGRFVLYAAGIALGYRVTVTKGAEVVVLRNVAIGNAQYLDEGAFISGAGLAAHVGDVANPHAVTQAQVGISAAMQPVNAAASLAAARAAFGSNIIDLVAKSANYTFALGDIGVLHPVADNNARTFTIPANAAVAFPVNTCLTFVNEIAVVTIAITTDTLIWAGIGSAGSRSLAASGIATAIKVSATKWIISGNGLT